MLEPIKVKAIEAAVRTITNLGCNFKVIAPDGTEWGDLAVEKAKTHTKVNKFAQTGYVQKIQALGVGDIAVIEWPQLETIEGLRKAMIGCGVRTWGLGSCISDIDREKRTVTVLRQA